MNIELTRERFIGIAGSGVFCLALFVFLLMTYISTQIKTGEEGILVNFGTVDAASGSFTPRSSAQKPPQPEVRPRPQPVEKPVIQRVNAPKVTQTKPVIKGNEPSAAVDDELKRKQRLETERIIAQKEAAARAEAERKALEAIKSQVSGAFDGNAGESRSGTAQTGAGVQGNPDSASSTGNPAGGGYGRFNLSGRSLNGEILRQKDFEEEGTIVINITVDWRGNVVNTGIGRGTNIDNARQRSYAEAAARRAKFNSIAPGSNNQSGTITFIYSFSVK
jgi:hypothetical protein